MDQPNEERQPLLGVKPGTPSVRMESTGGGSVLSSPNTPESSGGSATPSSGSVGRRSRGWHGHGPQSRRRGSFSGEDDGGEWSEGDGAASAGEWEARRRKRTERLSSDMGSGLESDLILLDRRGGGGTSDLSSQGGRTPQMGRRRGGRAERARIADIRDEESVLEQRHEELNRLFGFKKWKGHVRHKDINERSSTLQALLLDKDILDPAAWSAAQGASDEPEEEAVRQPSPAPQKCGKAMDAVWGCMAVSWSNYFWAGTFGWMLALMYLLVALVLALSYVGLPYARLAVQLARYFLWPFQKYVCLRRGMERAVVSDGGQLWVNPTVSSYQSLPVFEEIPLHASSSASSLPSSPGRPVAATPCGRSMQSLAAFLRALKPDEPLSVGFVLWLMLWGTVLLPIHLIVLSLSWESVMLIPMSKLMQRVLKHSYYHPLSLEIETSYPGAGREVLICIFKAANHYYYKYSVFGMNIMLLNLLPFCLLTLIIGYVFPYILPEEADGARWEAPSAVRTILSLISAVPLTYYIGSAVSSLSAQANPAVGAVLNASFGSIVDLIVYCLAIAKGGLNGLVQAGVTGSLLGMMLFTPGLCMIAGGFRYRQQRFSSAAAGVSIVLLFVALIGAFIPTIFYNLFGARTLSCQECLLGSGNSTDIFHPVLRFNKHAAFTTRDVANQTTLHLSNFSDWNCNFCIWGYTNIDDDPMYKENARILQYVVACIMPLAYLVGLVFTLKTHTHIYEIIPDPHDEADEHEGGGHDAPEWNKRTAFAILICATALFALIAEELVDSLNITLDAIGITPAFAGLTIIALITNLSEIVNAIRFSLQNDFALALEIATGCSIQIFLLQMPLLVLFSAIWNHGAAINSFTLIFPWLDVIAVTLALFVINYISIDGKANYFTGSALFITYIILIVAFWFAPESSATVV